MTSRENVSKVETAIDLTESERSRLYDAMKVALTKRGRFVSLRAESLKALKYVDPDETLPRVRFNFTVSPEELEARNIPYDSLSLGRELDRPQIVSFGAGRTVMRSIMLPNGDELPVMGEDVQGLTLSRGPQSGVVVECEGSTGLYYDANGSKITIDPGAIMGRPLELHGVDMHFLNGEAMTRPELLDLTVHIEKLTETN